VARWGDVPCDLAWGWHRYNILLGSRQLSAQESGRLVFEGAQLRCSFLQSFCVARMSERSPMGPRRSIFGSPLKRTAWTAVASAGLLCRVRSASPRRAHVASRVRIRWKVPDGGSSVPIRRASRPNFTLRAGVYTSDATRVLCRFPVCVTGRELLIGVNAGHSPVQSVVLVDAANHRREPGSSGGLPCVPKSS
jgi:hypothetical protein